MTGSDMYLRRCCTDKDICLRFFTNRVQQIGSGWADRLINGVSDVGVVDWKLSGPYELVLKAPDDAEQDGKEKEQKQQLEKEVVRVVEKVRFMSGDEAASPDYLVIDI